jgi:hypothetical protein
LSSTLTTGHGNRPGLFTAVKYLTYLLLLANVFFFLFEELGALQHTFVGGFSVAQFVQVFAATIDTTAWVILLLLFELETSILDDEVIRGWVKRSLHGIRLLCGATIVWAFSGYCSELITLYQATPLPDFDACAAQGWSLLITMDNYASLDASNCASLGGAAIQIQDFNVVASPEVLRAVQFLGWVDVINAGAWILVVVLLEVEVRMQLRGNLTNGIVQGTRYFKYALYSVLFAAAIYWGFAGRFLDVWDASLWLFAFIFIELNVFDWQQETQGEVGAAAAQVAGG